MFYSECIFSKKGALGAIWVAAHSHKKLKEEQVKQTNISSSVDKILLDEVPLVTYRILAYLLLGVARIYSKKVDYLFHDCHTVQNDSRHFAVSKRDNAHVETLCMSYSSITLPQRFELDAFDLEVLEGGSGDHVKPREEITLEGKYEGIGRHLFHKYHCEDNAADFEEYSAAYTPIKDICSPYFMDDDTLLRLSHNLSNSEVGMEKLQGNRFSLEECLDPMMLSETDEEPDLVIPFGEEHQTYGNPSMISEMIFREDEEPSDEIRSFYEGQHTSVEQIKFPEMTSKNCPVSITIDITPESNVPNASAPEFMAVHTPSTMERAKVLKKRKCLFDDSIVLPNKVLKQFINDSSDLVRKQKKAPHTALLTWKAHQLSNLPLSFFEPLITNVSLDLRSLICQKKLKIPEPVEVEGTPAKTDGLRSPTIHRSPGQEAVAPSTPVTHSSSWRYSENRGSTNSDSVEPASSFESIEKEPSSIEDRKFDVSSMNEELNLYEEDDQEEDDWPVRTRSVVRCLRRNFLTRKKRGEDEAVNLSQVQKGKTKKESASLFYVLLVLKSGGYVNVRQDGAYDDIFVLETPKLKQSCEADGDWYS